MKVLQLNKELLSLYSLWYNSDGTPWHIKLIRQIKITLMIFCLLFGWASSVVLIVKYIAIDLQKSLYAVFQVAAEFGANYTVVVACLYPESTEGIFKRLNDIRDKVVDQRKSFFGCFETTDRLCHKLTSLMVNTMLVVYIIITIVQTVLNTAYCYFRDDGIDPQCLYVPYKFSSPWDQNTLIGRCGTIIFCAIQAIIYIYVTTSFLSFFISCGLQFNAFRIYMKGLIDELDHTTEHKTVKDSDIQDMFRHMIDYHVAVKDTFWITAEMFNRFTFIQVLAAVVFMSSNLLNIDLAFRNLGADVGVIFYVTMASLTNLYFYCYFGDYTSNTFAKYPQYLFESRWYRMPVKFQKYYIMLIANTQRPLQYDGFRLVTLNLETFLKVLKTAGSYYLIMKAAVFQ